VETFVFLWKKYTQTSLRQHIFEKKFETQCCFLEILNSSSLKLKHFQHEETVKYIYAFVVFVHLFIPVCNQELSAS
jgi:hypothetical protein